MAEACRMEPRATDGSQPGCEELVLANLGFVLKIAAEYRGCPLPQEDLVSEGSIGLIEAAQRYDPGRGAKFITYAGWWVRKRILAALGERCQLVRVPARQAELARRVRDAERALTQQMGRSPDRQELSEATSVRTEQLDRIRPLGRREVSLEERLSHDSETTLGSRLADEADPGAESDLIARETCALVAHVLQQLEHRERLVLCHRFGIAGRPVLTQREVGERLHISRERVRQIEVRAKARLRRLLRKHWAANPLNGLPFPSGWRTGPTRHLQAG